MRTRGTGRRGGLQDDAFRDLDVIAIATALATYSDPRLNRLARESMISPQPYTTAVLQARLDGAATPPALLQAARNVVEAGARIAAIPDQDTRGRRKGALLERYVWEMVKERCPRGTEREQEIRLDVHTHSGRAWTQPKEVVANSDPFEAYECKWSGRIDQGDLEELGDIWLTAHGEGIDARPVIAMMASERDLRSWIAAKALAFREVLYFAEMRDLHEIKVRAPSRRLY